MTGSEDQTRDRERELAGTGIPLGVLRDASWWSYFLEHGYVPDHDGCPAIALEELDLVSLARLRAHLQRTGEQPVVGTRIARLARARMKTAPGTEIVRAVEHCHFMFKDAHAALERREPDPEASQAIVAAHDAGELPSWLAAALLGAARDRAGYAKVLEILGAGDRLMSEDYAAGAALRIAGPACEHDLARAIDTLDDGNARRAAAYVLGAIATDSALAFLLSAVARGRLRAKGVAGGLVRSSVDPGWLVLAMQSEHVEVRRVVPMLLAERARVREHDERASRELERCAASMALRQALAGVLEEGEEVCWSADRKEIERWLAET